MRSLWLAPGALFAIAVSSCVVQADTVYNSLNRAYGCVLCAGYGVEGDYPSPETALSVAAGFTPNADYLLTGADVQLLGIAGGTMIDIAVYSDTNNLPGSPLASLGSVTPPVAGPAIIFNANNLSNGVELSASVPYWLVLTAGTPNASAIWVTDGIDHQPVALTDDPTGMSGWFIPDPTGVLQFEIDGTALGPAIPEPSSGWLCLVALGFAMLLLVAGCGDILRGKGTE